MAAAATRTTPRTMAARITVTAGSMAATSAAATSAATQAAGDPAATERCPPRGGDRAVAGWRPEWPRTGWVSRRRGQPGGHGERQDRILAGTGRRPTIGG